VRGSDGGSKWWCYCQGYRHFCWGTSATIHHPWPVAGSARLSSHPPRQCPLVDISRQRSGAWQQQQPWPSRRAPLSSPRHQRHSQVRGTCFMMVSIWAHGSRCDLSGKSSQSHMVCCRLVGLGPAIINLNTNTNINNIILVTPSVFQGQSTLAAPWCRGFGVE
jgi:hypothetical protein